jgi:hypothetical protein
MKVDVSLGRIGRDPGHVMKRRQHNALVERRQVRAADELLIHGCIGLGPITGRSRLEPVLTPAADARDVPQQLVRFDHRLRPPGTDVFMFAFFWTVIATHQARVASAFGLAVPALLSSFGYDSTPRTPSLALANSRLCWLQWLTLLTSFAHADCRLEVSSSAFIMAPSSISACSS